MNTKKVLGFTGFGLAFLGGCFWMIGQSSALIVWGLTFLIIVKLNQ